MIRTAIVGKFSKEYILLLEKIIDNNGCWRSAHVDNGNQVQISINGHLYILSRVVMCLWHDIKYDSYRILARHTCNNGVCFNPDHIIPGSDSDNVYDSVKAGTHRQIQKKVCPKCGGEYTSKRVKDRLRGIIRIARRCEPCRKRKRREGYRKNETQSTDTK